MATSVAQHDCSRRIAAAGQGHQLVMGHDVVGASGKLPELQHVAHTNFCDIGFALDKSGRRLVIVSCLDNLGKGAAGQAVQNFNHMLGIEEQTALQ